MSTALQIAIAKLRQAGNRISETQVYYFDDYDPETCDATANCNRLGIPFTDDIIIEFPIKRTFNPLSAAEIATLSNRLGASNPNDYTSLLAEFGACHLPGSSDIALYSPDSAIAATRDEWGFKNPLTTPVLAISHYNHECDGDSIGFRRAGKAFAPELYVFKHELRYKGDDPKEWTERIAESLSEFIVSYVDSLL